MEKTLLAFVEDIFHERLPELAGSPQSSHADDLLELFTTLLLPDAAFMDRVKRHYRRFRATVDQPRNPLLRRRKPGG